MKRASLVGILLLALLGTAAAAEDRRQLAGKKGPGKKPGGKKGGNHEKNITLTGPDDGTGKRGKYEQWKRKYGRGYTAQEDAMRYQEFLKADTRLANINANNDGSAVFEHNQFSDRTDAELGRIANAKFGPDLPSSAPAGRRALRSSEAAASRGFHPRVQTEAELQGAGRELLGATTATYPASIDWSSYFPAPLDQGQCGSCYAFSTAMQIAAQINIAYRLNPNTTQPPSPEFVLECGDTPAGQGCEGGDPLSVMQRLFTTYGGVWPLSARPYSQYNNVNGATTPNCPAPKTNNRTTGTGGYPYGTALWTNQTGSYSNTEAGLMAALQTGPVVVGIDVESSFYLYKSGIFRVDCTDTTTGVAGPVPSSLVNHAVVAVGYGTDSAGNNYWKLLNSWSSTWGENGYFRMKRGAYPTSTNPNAPTGLCGVGSMFARVNVVPTNSSVSPPPAPPPLPSPPNPPSPPDMSTLVPGYRTVPCSTPNVSVVYMTGCKSYPALCGAYIISNRTCAPLGQTAPAPIFVLTPAPAAYANAKPSLFFVASQYTWLIGPASRNCTAVGLGAPYYNMYGVASSALSLIEGATFTDGAAAICGVAATPAAGRRLAE